jgi:hypothetical protein
MTALDTGSSEYKISEINSPESDEQEYFLFPIFLILELKQIPIIGAWLDMQSLGHLDMVMSIYSARNPWLIKLKWVMEMQQ